MVVRSVCGCPVPALPGFVSGAAAVVLAECIRALSAILPMALRTRIKLGVTLMQLASYARSASWFRK